MKKSGKGGFGKSGGGSGGFKTKVIDSVMDSKMVPKGGGKMGKKGY